MREHRLPAGEAFQKVYAIFPDENRSPGLRLEELMPVQFTGFSGSTGRVNLMADESIRRQILRDESIRGMYASIFEMGMPEKRVRGNPKLL